jgi:hypothetical protein
LTLGIKRKKKENPKHFSLAGSVTLKGQSYHNWVQTRHIKGLSGEMQMGRKWAQTMRTNELYDRFASVFIFKETPSREKHKTSFVA